MILIFSYYDKSCCIACVYSADPLADVPRRDCRKEVGSAQADASSSTSPTTSARRDWVVALRRLRCSDVLLHHVASHKVASHRVASHHHVPLHHVASHNVASHRVASHHHAMTGQRRGSQKMDAASASSASSLPTSSARRDWVVALRRLRCSVVPLHHVASHNVASHRVASQGYGASRRVASHRVASQGYGTSRCVASHRRRLTYSPERPRATRCIWAMAPLRQVRRPEVRFARADVPRDRRPEVRVARWGGGYAREGGDAHRAVSCVARRDWAVAPLRRVQLP